MRKKFNIKSKLAGALAAVMVFSMTAPGIPVYAVNHGDQSVIEFDPQAGPDLSHSSYSTMPRRDTGVSYATGQAGFPLISSNDFSGIPTENFGSGERPKIPEFQVDWPGYTFDGWYNEAGNKIETLPYAFPYSAVSSYKAVWKGNATTPFRFTVMHYRDLNIDRDGNNDGTDAGAWPPEGASDLWKFYESGDWTREVMANTPISATYRRDIPGYRLKSVLIKNNRVRRYDEPSGQGRLDGGADINTTTKAVRGNMPNDDLTVAYRYEPDPTKKFAVYVEYVDSNGTQIRTPDTYTFSAETEIDIAPAQINAYSLQSGALKEGFEGTDDLEGQGIYSAASAGCSFDEAMHYRGKMPNQPVTVQYKYNIDPNFHTVLQVKRIDNHGNPMEDDEIREITPADPVIIDVEQKTGYDYPPNIHWDEHFTGTQSSFNPDDGTLTLSSDMQGGTVTITYNENLSDESYWSKIEYYNGTNGTISGDTSPKFKKHGTYTIDELTAGVNLSPSSHYLFDGWYRANANGSDKTGDRLEGSLAVSQNIKLFANFEENPNEWFDLTFGAGAHGSLSGVTSIHTGKGTPWTDLNLPQTVPDPYYIFAGWFDESGNRVQESQVILASQHYTARFVPASLEDDGILAMPDARGAVAGDGSGKVTVSGANEERRYALTDGEHRILQVKTGAQLQNSDFTGLYPCTLYYVYELSMSAEPAVGTILPEHTDASDYGPPSQVTVPALGSNYQVSRDTAEGRLRLTINPAAYDTYYAIMDIDGNTLFVPGSDADGWVLAESTRNEAVLGDLEPNQLYIVVAKHAGEMGTPADRQTMGTQVSVIYAGQEEKYYTISLTNGGYIDEIIRNGSVIETEEHAVSAIVKKGDTVKINAEITGYNGQAFKQWNPLIGSPQIFVTRRNQTITMPGQNVVLQAVYEMPSTATPGNATVDYAPRDGKNALDLSENYFETLIQTLTDNAEDREAMTAGIDVEYTVKFNRRAPKASESNAVKAEMWEDSESVKIPWALSSALTRKVGGTNKGLPEDGNPAPGIRVYSEIDESMLGYLDYRLWKVENPEGTPVCTEIPMTPDPNGDGADFTGTIAFDAHVGETYLLTYLKAHEITVVDTKRAAVHRLKVKSQTSLEETEAFGNLNIFEDYTDPVTGIVYEYGGLGKTESASSEYDITTPVTKAATLYVLYRAADDSEWQAARQKLMEQIAIAQTLMNNSSVSEENRQLLSSAVVSAQEVVNRTYRPAIEELLQEYETLKALVDSISSGGPVDPDDPNNPNNPDDPNNPNNPDDPENPNNPENPNHPGGSGGGSGSGSRGRSLGSGYTFNRYRTYYVGTDGYWEQTGMNGGQWAFVLYSGQRLKNQWANVKYNDLQQLYTYHFNAEGIMDTGWYQDAEGEWYYLNSQQGRDEGCLRIGWYFDEKDAKWYYLNQFTGGMLVGWQNVGDNWYYLSPVKAAGHPLGSLYTGEITPDGYPVDENGSWIRETP